MIWSTGSRRPTGGFHSPNVDRDTFDRRPLPKAYRSARGIARLRREPYCSPSTAAKTAWPRTDDRSTPILTPHGASQNLSPTAYYKGAPSPPAIACGYKIAGGGERRRSRDLAGCYQSARITVEMMHSPP